MVIFSSNTSYFSLYNYGLGHPTLCVNLSDSSGLDHSLGSRVIAVFSKRRCLVRNNLKCMLCQCLARVHLQFARSGHARARASR